MNRVDLNRACAITMPMPASAPDSVPIPSSSTMKPSCETVP